MTIELLTPVPVPVLYVPFLYVDIISTPEATISGLIPLPLIGPFEEPIHILSVLLLNVPTVITSSLAAYIVIVATESGSKNLVSGAIKFLFGKYMSYSPFIISSEVNLKIHTPGFISLNLISKFSFPEVIYG